MSYRELSPERVIRMRYKPHPYPNEYGGTTSEIEPDSDQCGVSESWRPRMHNFRRNRERSSSNSSVESQNSAASSHHAHAHSTDESAATSYASIASPSTDKPVHTDSTSHTGTTVTDDNPYAPPSPAIASSCDASRVDRPFQMPASTPEYDDEDEAGLRSTAHTSQSFTRYDPRLTSVEQKELDGLQELRQRIDTYSSARALRANTRLSSVNEDLTSATSGPFLQPAMTSIPPTSASTTQVDRPNHLLSGSEPNPAGGEMRHEEEDIFQQAFYGRRPASYISDISQQSKKIGWFSRATSKITSVFHRQPKSYIDDSPLSSPAWRSRRSDRVKPRRRISASNLCYATDSSGNVICDDRGIPLPSSRDSVEIGEYAHSSQPIRIDLNSPVSPINSGIAPVRQWDRLRDKAVIPESLWKPLPSLPARTSQENMRPISPMTVWSRGGGEFRPDRYGFYNSQPKLCSGLGSMFGLSRKHKAEKPHRLSQESLTSIELASAKSEADRGAEQGKKLVKTRKKLDDRSTYLLTEVDRRQSELMATLSALDEDQEEGRLGRAFNHLQSTGFESERFTKSFFKFNHRRNRADLRTVGTWLSEQQAELDMYEFLHPKSRLEGIEVALPAFEFERVDQVDRYWLGSEADDIPEKIVYR